MIQWLAQALRKHGSDRANALHLVEEARARDYREMAAAHDAFVPGAVATGTGIIVGSASASDGREVTVRLGPQEQYAHSVVQGATGSGKTMFVLSLLSQELLAGRPFGIIDCKADLFEGAVRWAAAVAHNSSVERREALKNRIVAVNPFAPDHLVPLNVCRSIPGISAESQAFEITSALSRLFDSTLGIHMESILRHLILLLMESRLTLVEVPMVLQDEILRGVLASQSENPVVKAFFHRTYESIPQMSKDALLNRFQALLLSENIRLMLGADNLLDLRDVFDRGEHLFVFLGKGANVPEEQVDILGSLIFQLLLQFNLLPRERAAPTLPPRARRILPPA